MIFKQKYNNNNIKNDLNWKENNKKYLAQLQKFLDATDGIEKEETKNNIIIQMLKCDNILTQLAQREIKKYKLQMNNMQEKNT